jgi:CrcB protein
MDEFLSVWIGAGVGGVSRYYLGRWVALKLGTAFPYGTFVINVTGCLILGFFGTFAAKRVELIPTELRLLVAVGFVGAYTTFSTFGFETIQLMEDGSWLLAAAYVAGSVFVGLLAVYLGVMTARALVGAA